MRWVAAWRAGRPTGDAELVFGALVRASRPVLPWRGAVRAKPRNHQSVTVQLQPNGALQGVRGPSVQVIADDGMADPGQVHAQLVRSAGSGSEQHEGSFVAGGERS